MIGGVGRIFGEAIGVEGIFLEAEVGGGQFLEQCFSVLPLTVSPLRPSANSITAER